MSWHQSELQKSKARETGLKNKVHGLTGKRIYNIWRSMKSRCNNPKSNNFALYGGSGIKVCDEWVNSFENFLHWALDNGYTDKLTIDRINPKNGYCPENCRWSTYFEQANHKSNNKFFTYKGETKTIAEWSRDSRCKVNIITLSKRLSTYKWSINRALETPKLKRILLLNKLEISKKNAITQRNEIRS